MSFPEFGEIEGMNPGDLLRPYAERIVSEEDFSETTSLTPYEIETLHAVAAFAGILGMRGRDYVVTTQPNVVYVPPEDERGIYIPDGENVFSGTLLGFEIKKIDQESFQLYEVGLYFVEVHFSHGDDSLGLDEFGNGMGAELFVPIQPSDSLVEIRPRLSS